MTRTGRFLTSLLLSGYFAPAQAIPITFDLAGTLRQTAIIDSVAGTQTFDLSRAGTAFSAQFVLETDLFLPPIVSESELNHRLSFRSSTPEAVLRSFTLGGVDLPLSPYAWNQDFISVGDSKGTVCTEAGCRYAPDQWNLSMLSEEIGSQGASARRTISMGLVEDSMPGASEGGQWFDFDDGFDIGTIAALPLDVIMPPSLSMSDYRFSCAERCTPIGQSWTVFEVTSFTRSVGNVPEPGTLALLGVGLALGAALRRRREKA